MKRANESSRKTGIRILKPTSHSRVRDVIYDFTGMSGISDDVTEIPGMSNDVKEECYIIVMMSR